MRTQNCALHLVIICSNLITNLTGYDTEHELLFQPQVLYNFPMNKDGFAAPCGVNPYGCQEKAWCTGTCLYQGPYKSAVLKTGAITHLHTHTHTHLVSLTTPVQ